MVLTVGRLLTHPRIGGLLRLAGGGSGTGNIINEVTVLEAPDLPDWLNGGELILTTLYSLRNDEKAQLVLLNDLFQKGIAALGVKTNRFILELSEDLLKKANDYGIPLLAIDRQAKFREIIYYVMREIINAQNVENLVVSLFDDLLYGRLIDEKDISDRASSLGWTAGKYHSIVLSRFNDGDPRIWLSCCQRYIELIKSHFPGSLSGIKKENIITLLSYSSEREDWLEKSKRLWQDIYDETLNFRENCRLLGVGFGEPVGSLSKLKESYDQARLVLDTGLTFFTGGPPLFNTRDLMAEILLTRSLRTAESNQLRSTFLVPLRNYDSRQSTELVKTLTVYLSSDDLAQAAQKLHVHPNTLRYRLQRVQEITGLNPTTGKGRLLFNLALILEKLASALPVE
ncbi:MAG: PucR family transcriptional regulator ligand-binding domain-containing protein [Firmicutes bacterium]|nr:PucR family transcriptional regulator ligand-binding domain-containing protein [Bacillota bacterium]